MVFLNVVKNNHKPYIAVANRAGWGKRKINIKRKEKIQIKVSKGFQSQIEGKDGELIITLTPTN